MGRILWVSARIAAHDDWLLRRVQRWQAPRWVRIWMVAATRCGDGWAWCALLPVVLAFGGQSRYPVVASTGLAGIAGLVLMLLLKRVSRRRRPCGLDSDGRVPPAYNSSFPSGHSTTAFAVAVPLILSYPVAALPLLCLALSIASSRIVLGMHFLSDVVAGCVMGAGLGYVFFRLFS